MKSDRFAVTVEKNVSHFFFVKIRLRVKMTRRYIHYFSLSDFGQCVRKKKISCVSPQIIKLMSHVLATGIQAGNTISQSLSCDPVVREEMHTPRTHLSSACCDREQS